MPNYRILTLDGGGVRGVLTARMLERIEASRPGFIARADLLAGTSVGAILALGLASGKTPTEMVNLDRDQSKLIFHDSLMHEAGELWGLNGARYTTENRHAGLHPTLGVLTLGELPKKVLVTTFQLDSENPLEPSKPGAPRTWKPKFFHNFPLDNSGSPNSDLNQCAVDIALRSSAAPTFFPVYQGFIDGGVVANNPGMCALAQAINPHTGQQAIKDVSLLSVGTGARAQWLETQNGDWGLRQWGFKLVELILETGSGLSDYQCQQLLGDCFRRMEVNFDKTIPLNAVDEIDHLVGLADSFADNAATWNPYVDWLDAHWFPA